jgi:hypothetical protein
MGVGVTRKDASWLTYGNFAEFAARVIWLPLFWKLECEDRQTSTDEAA